MSEDLGAVMGTTSGVKTMADDTLRISFDVEPRFAQLAFQLFGTRGTPVAIAKIVAAAALAHAQQDTIEQAKPRGGALCKLAGIFCNDEKFREWLRLTYDPLPRNAEDAATIIRKVCKIESRSELDHDQVAADQFHRHFRLPYAAWLDGRNK